jgi:hypothetical protein
MNCVINEHFNTSNLNTKLIENVSKWYGWMDLLQVYIYIFIKIYSYTNRFYGSHKNKLEPNKA